MKQGAPAGSPDGASPRPLDKKDKISVVLTSTVVYSVEGQTCSKR